MLRESLLSLMGMFVSLLFFPGIRPPAEEGDEYRHMMGGAFVGWLIASVLTHLAKPNRDG